MPIILDSSGGGSGTPAASATTTAQQVVDCTSQDVRTLLAASGTDANILLDFVNRTQLEVLRTSRWEFLLSDVKRFLTRKEQGDYWVGATGSQPQGAFDTGLNLTDVSRIREDSMFDRTNYRRLLRMLAPAAYRVAHKFDSQAQAGEPRFFVNDPNNVGLIQFYPAPRNQDTRAPEAEPPTVDTATSGALATRTYFVRITLVDEKGGESAASASVERFIPANQVALVRSPLLPITQSSSGVQYDRYRVYASTTENSETLQVTANIGTDWQEPDTGLVAGAAFPTTSTLEPLGGFVIEFRYYKKRPQITTLSTVLMVPDDYKDVMCAGVNALAFRYLRQPDEADYWLAVYKDGLRQIVKDINLHPKGPNFIQPDLTGLELIPTFHPHFRF